MTLGLAGRHDARHDAPPLVSDIPVVYMYVADALAAGIIAQREYSGRALVTGAEASIPLETQLRVMRMYKPVHRLAGIFNPAEENSVISARNLREFGEREGLGVLTIPLSLDQSGKPKANAIGDAVDQVAGFAPDFLVHLSSSHILVARKELFAHTMRHKLPVFASTDLPVTDGLAVLGAVTPLKSIGVAAAEQALRVLALPKGADLSRLPIPQIPAYEILINMKAARELGMPPPPTLLRLGRIID